MSLINDMLKDLEARGDHADVGSEVRVTSRTPARSRRGLPLVLGALVLGLVACIFYLLAGTGARVVAPPAHEPPVVAQTEATAEPAPVAPVREAVAVASAAETPTTVPATDVPDPAPVLASAPVKQDVAAAPAKESLPASTAPAGAAEESSAVIVRRHEPTHAELRARASREGFAALQRGDWPVASRLLTELVGMEPANDEAREGAAVALVRQGRLAEADGLLLDGLAVGTNPARFAKLRARVQASQADVTAALQSLSLAVPPVERDPEFHALRGALAQQAGEFELAIQTYRQLVAYAPDNATWQAGLAMALDATGDIDGAQLAYQRALAAGNLEAALRDHVQQRLSALEK